MSRGLDLEAIGPRSDVGEPDGERPLSSAIDDYLGSSSVCQELHRAATWDQLCVDGLVLIGLDIDPADKRIEAIGSDPDGVRPGRQGGLHRGGPDELVVDVDLRTWHGAVEL